MMYFFCILIAGIQIVNAQTKSISGAITSKEDGTSLPGVSVVVKGTTIGTVTDLDGKFKLNVPVEAKTLLLSFIGMKDQSIEITGQSTFNIVMEPDVFSVDEVMVVAYGTAKKSSFTGSAAQIESDQIELRPLTNATGALEGIAAGVQVSPGSGQPGTGSDVRIRGFGSINASSAPLYIVDGVPFSGNISNINPNDIESMSVLKDAASTALYGNKAANGVVIITTKKGKAGEGSISLSINEGITSRAIPEYDRVGPMDYYPLMWEAFRNDRAYSQGDAMEVANAKATAGIYTQLGYNPFNVANNEIVDGEGKLNPNAKLLYPEDLDWQEPIFGTGRRSDYNLSYQDGTAKSNYFVSLGYLNEDGYTDKSDYQRFSARANINFQPKDWFKTGLNIAGTTSTSNQAQFASSTGYVNPFFFTRNMGPIYPVYLHKPGTGEYILDNAGEKIYDLGNMTNLGGETRPSGASPGRHVIAETLWNEDLDKVSLISAKTYGEFYFLKDFKFTVNASLDKRYLYNINFDNKTVGDGAPAGRGGRQSTTTTSINYNQLLNYVKDLDKHTITAMLGHESLEYEYNYLNGFKQGLIADGNTELINFTTTNDLTSYTDTYRTEGFFGRVDYDYADRYYFSGSYRRDGSSKFGSDVRWGDFWSLGGAWRLDQEGFISSLAWIDMLKLRGSYGEVGNDSGISYYAYQALYSLGSNNANEPGALQSKLASANLVWESNNSFDLALEFGVFNKLSGTVEFFHRISDNLLFNVPLPVSAGLDSQDKNIGTMYNQGVEVSLTANLIKGNKFNWILDVNATTLKNKITKLPQEEIITGSKKYMVGHSRYDYWLREWYGVNPDNGEALYRANKWDATNSKVIGQDTVTNNVNNAKYHYAGTSIPDVYGGVTNTFTYGDFEFLFMFTYQVGGEILDYNYQGIMSSGNYGSAKHVDILKRWQKPGDISDFPRVDVSKTSQFDATSDRWLTDASFFSLKQMRLSYNVPATVVSKWKIKGARVYASGENLWMKTARKGMDVQQNFDGTTSNTYTPAKVVSLGLNVSF
jgi:TonB-linked SusC/RagA family outer membrane protein